MNKFLFLNTGWMDSYQGIDNDKIKGGGKHIDDLGWGGEIFNFKDFQGKFYGYVQPKISLTTPSIIRIERLGALTTDKKIEGITVVWTATHPDFGGTRIVGWFKNAIVYREQQVPPRLSERVWQGNKLNYYVVAKSKDCKLLPEIERGIIVPRQQKNGMGQSNVWYADKNPKFVRIVHDLIYKGINPIVNRPKRSGMARQPDSLKRVEVEKKAIIIVSKYFEKQGYTIKSFEKDNIGWDLMASRNKDKLKLEVKGLSGQDILTELTPNEFKHLKADSKFYRLCIVTETLTKPTLNIFAFSRDNQKWTSQDGLMTIEFQEIIGARISTKYTKAQFLKEFKESIKYIKLAEQGKVKPRLVKHLLKEL